MSPSTQSPSPFINPSTSVPVGTNQPFSADINLREQRVLTHAKIQAGVDLQQIREFESWVASEGICTASLNHNGTLSSIRDRIKSHFPVLFEAMPTILTHLRIQGFAHLVGLNFDKLTAANAVCDSRGAFGVGLTSFLGTAATGNYHAPTDSTPYRYVQPRTIKPGEVLTLVNSNRDGFPHTDSAFKHPPEDYVTLFAVKAASDGGLSEVWHANDIVAWLSNYQEGLRALAILREQQFPFIGSILEAEKILYHPILALGSDGQQLIRYKRDAIDDAQKVLGRPLNETLQFAIDMLEAATMSCPRYKFLVETGDALIGSNNTTLHSRTPFNDLSRCLFKTTNWRSD